MPGRPARPVKVGGWVGGWVSTYSMHKLLIPPPASLPTCTTRSVHVLLERRGDVQVDDVGESWDVYPSRCHLCRHTDAEFPTRETTCIEWVRGWVGGMP